MQRIAGERIQRPPYVWVGIGLAALVGVMAVPVGFAMIADPNGSPVGIPNEWIAGSVFRTFLLPGLVLFTVNGLGQLGAAALAATRHPLAPWLMGAVGVALLIWIAVQVLVIPMSFLQPTIFVIGLVESVVALLWLRRLGHLGAR